MKAYKGIGMEGVIARWYAASTGKDRVRHTRMAALIAGRLWAGARVLEVAPGPGYFCIELARLGDYRTTGVDISESFVRIARENARTAAVSVDFQHGNASALPFADASFDVVICQAAFKNFSEPVRAISEMHRVLAPGGTALLVDLRSDVTMDDIDREVRAMDLGIFSQAFTRFTFRHMLIKRAYSVEEIRTMVGRTAFGNANIEINPVGFTAWMEKTTAGVPQHVKA